MTENRQEALKRENAELRDEIKGLTELVKELQDARSPASGALSHTVADSASVSTPSGESSLARSASLETWKLHQSLDFQMRTKTLRGFFEGQSAFYPDTIHFPDLQAVANALLGEGRDLRFDQEVMRYDHSWPNRRLPLTQDPQAPDT